MSIATTAIATAYRLRREPLSAGSASDSSTATVRKRGARRGRSQGQKISHRLSAVATKWSPNPPKISFTPPKVFSAPASAAQSAPPAIPARMDRLMTSAGFQPLSCSVRSIQVVKIAPSVIWPSMPIFHNPVVNVTNRPAVTNSSGTHEIKTSENLPHDPTEPVRMFQKASSGGALLASSTNVVNNNARTIAPACTRRLNQRELCMRRFLTAEQLPELFHRQLPCVQRRRDLPCKEHQHPVAILPKVVQVGRNEYDGRALRAALLELAPYIYG